MFTFYFLIPFSIIISLLFNYFFNSLFLKRDKIDQINSRSSHSVVATKSGGISIFFCIATVTLFLYAQNLEIYDFSLLLPLSVIFFTGVYDDFYNADFKIKFFIQIIVAKLLIDQGFIINNLHGLFGLYEIPNLISQLVTVFAFLIIVNAVNFSDGIDGLASILIIYFLIAFEFLMDFKSSLFYFNMFIILIILPFFLFNVRKNNKVFLGDAGSLFLGSIVAINSFNFLSFSVSNKSEYNSALMTVTILIYPLLDLLRVFLIRLRNGNSPFIADKNHLHHRLSKIFESHYLRSLTILLFNLILFVSILFLDSNFESIFSIIILLVSIISILKIK